MGLAGEADMAIEWWIVLATLGGPVLAIQTQKFIERASENRRQKLAIFATLMANRATRLNDDYVRALNSIELGFLPRWGAPQNRNVVNAWRTLLGELNNPPVDEPNANMIWNRRCEDRLVELLLAMSCALGYQFTSEELRRGVYYPTAKADLEQAQLGVLLGARAMLEGKSALQMKVVEFSNDPEVAAAQKAMLKSMGKSYTNEGELKVRISEEVGKRRIDR
jgi:hypothetical protein